VFFEVLYVVVVDLDVAVALPVFVIQKSFFQNPGPGMINL
tara:strand:+ start:1348 stop:1467 length:120 start_codon:yes stop_codon:yes gene_type:complete